MMAETKNKKVIRNIEIPSDWEVRRFGDICKINGRIGYRGYTVEDIVQKGEGAITLSPSNFKNGKLDYSDCTYISWFKYEESPEIQISNGDILLVKTGSTFGKSALVDNLVEKATINPQIVVIKEVKSDVHYLSFLISNQIFQKQINEVVVGGAIPTLSQENILNFKIPLPPLPEQKAIAQVLSTADAAIHTTEKLIAQKELRKKWLMKQLLTGKKRLKGFENTKWKIQPLENFIKPIVREVSKPSTPYLGIGLRSHGKGTFLKYDEQPEKNSMDKFYVVRPNDLIVNITFAWEQAIAIVRPEDDGALASHRFPTYTFIEEKGHPDFFRFFILQPRMKFMLEMISPGGAGRNRVMSKSDFIKLEFLLPDYKEQTAIAQVLQAADKEITLLKAKAEKLRELKKGLMQQLLTGKIRLKIN